MANASGKGNSVVFINTKQSGQEKQSGIADEQTVAPTKLWEELVWLVLILVVGLATRLVFIKSFPSRPISDFLNILDFSILFRDDWLARGAWEWYFFSPGLPLILSGILRFINRSPETIARWATALSTGLVPLLPFILWKDVFRLRTRVLAALLLALWPGQILFSSVLAQDNWIIFPTVALSVLAVRVLVMRRDGYPILAALLYAVTVAIRQEMLVALLPAAIIAILGGRPDKRIRNFIIGSSVIGVIFAFLILQRGWATGRYALTTEHFGMSILGAYIPGAGMGWISPISYIDAVDPKLLDHGELSQELDRGALKLTVQEFLRRPGFQAIRIFGSTLTNIFEMDKQITWWSLGAEGVLPHPYRKAALALTDGLAPILQFYPMMATALFLSSIFFALSQRYWLKWISPILATILLKIGIHAVIVSQPRYFLVVVALELLTFAMITEMSFKPRNWKISALSLILGILSVWALSSLTVQAQNYVLTHDEFPQLIYNFPLKPASGQVQCTMKQGQLLFYDGDEASFELLNLEPQPNESAIVNCEVNSSQPQTFNLLVFDPYAPGGFPGRVEQIVSVNGKEALHHDMADEPGASWLEIPLGKVGPQAALSFSVEMKAINPDPGWGWGRATSTQFRVESVN